MSHDLERALNDLADAAAHTAQRGILAEPTLPSTLHRVVGRVKRRRAVRATAAGTLALALVGGATSAVNFGLSARHPGPPAAEQTPSEPTPTTTEAPTEVPTGLECGASDEYLQTLGDPYVTPPVVGATASYLPDTAVDAVLQAPITVDNLGAERLDVLDATPTLVLVRDGTIVGGGAFDQGTRGPALAGEAAEFWMTQPAVACAADGAEVGVGSEPLDPGEYGAWVLITATPLGASEAVQNVGGPFALTLTDPAAVVTDPAAGYFRCGEPLDFDIQTRPLAHGLTLSADFPETWGSVAPEWFATLGASDGRTIHADVGVVPGIAFVDASGAVAGYAWGSTARMDLGEVGPTTTVTLAGPTYLLACGPDGIATAARAAEGLPAGTYAAWPFTTAVVKEVQHTDGTAEVPSAEPVVVMGDPHQVTFTG